MKALLSTDYSAYGNFFADDDVKQSGEDELLQREKFVVVRR